MKTLSELKSRLFDLESTMVYTFAQQRDRNREMFEISMEIERLENPESYQQNIRHWQGHENRF